MNRVAVRSAIAALAVAAGALLAPQVSAAPVEPVDDPVTVTAAERYWACVAVDHVEVGACLGNPYPDLSQHPTVPELVERVTGVELPTIPRR